MTHCGDHPLVTMARALRQAPPPDEPWQGLLAKVDPDLLAAGCHQAVEPFVCYDDMRRANAAGALYQSFNDGLSDAGSPLQQTLFMAQYRLRQRILGGALAARLTPPGPTLEVGCAILDRAARSFLSAAVPTALADLFSYCDINPAVVATSLENNAAAPIVMADMASLAQHFAHDSFDYAVGANALDTLCKRHLEQAMGQLHALLRRDGVLLHFLCLEPYHHAFFRDVIGRHRLTLPMLQPGNRRAVCVVDRAALPLLQRLSPLAAFLVDYAASLNGRGRERLWTGLTRLDAGRLLTDLSATLIAAKAAYQITALQNYIDRMTAAASFWKIIEAGFLTASAAVPLPPACPLAGAQLIVGPEGLSQGSRPPEESDSLSLTINVHCMAFAKSG